MLNTGQWRNAIHYRTDVACGCPDPVDPCMVMWDSRDRELTVLPCPAHAFDDAEWNERLAT